MDPDLIEIDQDSISGLVSCIVLTIVHDQSLHDGAIRSLESSMKVVNVVFHRAIQQCSMVHKKLWEKLSVDSKRIIKKLVDIEVDDYIFCDSHSRIEKPDTSAYLIHKLLVKEFTVKVTVNINDMCSIETLDGTLIHVNNTTTENTEMITPIQKPATFTTPIEKRENLVFGHELSKLTKPQLMSVIREAKNEAASYKDLADESSYAAGQITSIEAGISVCVKALDKKEK